MAIERFHEPPDIAGFLHRPAATTPDGLILTHGAGSNCQAPLFLELAEAFCASGFLVLRCDLPFRQRRPRGSPFPAEAAADRAGLRHAVAALRQLAAGRILLGGHSYGGRQASLLAAEDPALVDGLLLCSYPLHPPGKPDQPRTAHLPSLLTPALFVHGKADPFGSLDEMQAALARIPAATRLLAVEKAGHDLARRAVARRRLCAEIVAAARAFLAPGAASPA